MFCSFTGTSSTESETETKQAALKKFKKGKKVRLDFTEPKKKSEGLKKKKVLKKLKRVQPEYVSQKENKKVIVDKKMAKKSEAVARKAVARALKVNAPNILCNSFQGEPVFCLGNWEFFIVNLQCVLKSP